MTGQGVVQVQGQLVELDALRIAERINEHDPNLRVQYFEGQAGLDQPPFQIVERCRDGKDRVVFSCWQLDARVLERILAADTQVVDVLANLDENNAKLAGSNKQRYRERIGEANELAASILASPKDTYRATVDGEKKIFRA